MLDECVVLNLPRSRKRRKLCIKNLKEAGVPHEKIRIWVAHDHKHFESVPEVCESAIKDGFPLFSKLVKKHKDFLGEITQTWNNMRWLREIANNEKTIVFLQDDWYLTNFEKLNRLVDFAFNIDPFFEYIGLYYNWKHRINPHVRPVLDGTQLLHGIMGFCQDVGMIITPDGAKNILNLWEHISTLEVFFVSLMENCPPHFYTSAKSYVKCTGLPSVFLRERRESTVVG